MNSNILDKQLDFLIHELSRLNKPGSAQKIMYLISDPSSLPQEYFIPVAPHFIKDAFNRIISSYCDCPVVKYKNPNCPDTLFTLVLASIWTCRASVYQNEDIFCDIFASLLSGFLNLQKKSGFSEKFKENLFSRKNFSKNLNFKQNSEENIFNFYTNLLPSFLYFYPRKDAIADFVSSQIAVLIDTISLRFSHTLLRLASLLAAAAPSSQSYDAAFTAFTAFASPPSPHDSILASELCAWAARDFSDEPCCSLGPEIIAALCSTFSDSSLSRYCFEEIGKGFYDIVNQCESYSDKSNTFLANNLIASMLKVKHDNTAALGVLIPVIAELPKDSLPLGALKKLWLSIAVTAIYEDRSYYDQLSEAIPKLAIKTKPLLVQSISSVNQLILGSSSSDLSIQALTSLSAALATPQAFDTHLLSESFIQSTQQKIPFSQNPLPKSTFNQFSNNELSKALQRLPHVAASHLLVALELESMRAQNGVAYFIYSYFSEIVSVLPVEEQIGSATIDNLTESSAPIVTVFSTICDFVFVSFIKNSLKTKNIENFLRLFAVLISYKTHQNSQMREIVTRHLQSLLYFCPFLLISERIWEILSENFFNFSKFSDFCENLGIEKYAISTNNNEKLLKREVFLFKDVLLSALRINFPGFSHLFAKKGALRDFNNTVLPLPNPEFFVSLGTYKTLPKSFDEFIDEKNIIAATISLINNMDTYSHQELIHDIRTLTSFSPSSYSFAIVDKNLRPLFLLAVLGRIPIQCNDISILEFTQQLLLWVTSSIELINNQEIAFVIYQQFDESLRAAMTNCIDFELFLCWAKLGLNLCAYLNYLERFLKDQKIFNEKIEKISKIEKNFRNFIYRKIVEFLGKYDLFEVTCKPQQTLNALRGIYAALYDDEPSYWIDADPQDESLRSIISLIIHRVHYRISAMAMQFMTSPPDLSGFRLRLPSVLMIGEPHRASFRLPVLSAAPRLTLNSVPKQVYLDNLGSISAVSPDLLVRLPQYFNVHEEISHLTRNFLIHEIIANPRRFSHNPKAVYCLIHAPKIEDEELLRSWEPDSLPGIFKLLSLPEKSKYRSLYEYACRCISLASTSQLISYLPQITLVLIHSGVNSKLFETIYKKAETSPIFTIDLLWSLQSESPNGDALIETLLSNLSEKIKKIYFLEKSFVAKMTEISGKLLPIPKYNRKTELDNLLKEFAATYTFTYEFLPISPQFIITGIVPSGTPLKSHAKVPLLLHFEVVEFSSIEESEEFILNPDFSKLQTLKKTQKSCIFKLGDDVRQDFLALQLIEEVNQKINQFYKNSINKSVGLWLKSYRILPTNSTDGVIEVLSAQSRDQIGQQVDGSLIDYYVSKYGSSGAKSFQKARKNFISSMSCYSIMTYILQVKDRHNGNIMIDNDGHIIHIDFGFIFDISPGRNAGVENAPFKLTRDMFNTMGGSRSSADFEDFIIGVFYCYLLARESIASMKTLVTIMQQSNLPCYKKNTIRNFVSRFKIDLDEYELWDQVNHMINVSLNNMRTNIYDRMQHLQNQIEF